MNFFRDFEWQLDILTLPPHIFRENSSLKKKEQARLSNFVNVTTLFLRVRVLHREILPFSSKIALDKW